MRNPQSIACEVGSHRFQDKLHNSDSLLIVLFSLLRDTIIDYSLIMYIYIYMKLDPDIHIVMHSVFFLKPGVTATFVIQYHLCRRDK